MAVFCFPAPFLTVTTVSSVPPTMHATMTRLPRGMAARASAAKSGFRSVAVMARAPMASFLTVSNAVRPCTGRNSGTFTAPAMCCFANWSAIRTSTITALPLAWSRRHSAGGSDARP